MPKEVINQIIVGKPTHNENAAKQQVTTSDANNEKSAYSSVDNAYERSDKGPFFISLEKSDINEHEMGRNGLY